LRRGCHTSS